MRGALRSPHALHADLTETHSRIFRWYEEDFGDVIGFVLRYLDAGPASTWLARHRDRARLIHRPYSWDLNAQPWRS